MLSYNFSYVYNEFNILFIMKIGLAHFKVPDTTLHNAQHLRIIYINYLGQ